jgi:hypothetical protein
MEKGRIYSFLFKASTYNIAFTNNSYLIFGLTLYTKEQDNSYFDQHNTVPLLSHDDGL